MKKIFSLWFLLIVFALPLTASALEMHDKVYLDDILIVSVSGYIDITYGVDTFSHTDEEYVNRFIEVLNKELAQSIVECNANTQLLETKQQPPLLLSENLRTILNSLHVTEEHDRYILTTSDFEDYKIISSILIKYARNRDNLYFHQDYRDYHPGCLVSARRHDTQCQQWKKKYYFDEKVPLLGKVDREAYLPNSDNSSGTSAGHDLLDSQCGHLMRDLLPRPYSREIKSTYDQYINQTCEQLGTLKKGLRRELEIDSQNRRDGGNTPIANEQNSTFDAFRTQERIAREVY